MRTRRLLGGAAVMVALAAAPAPTAVAQIPPLPVCMPDGPCKLSTGLDDARVIDPVLAPNGERVVLIHQGENLLVDLYSVPVAGGFPVKISLSSEECEVCGDQPGQYAVLYTLPDGTGEPGDPMRRELSACQSPGRPRPASSSPPTSAPATRVGVSPDSRKVVFAPPGGEEAAGRADRRAGRAPAGA